jgi:hypothetical protein
LLASIAQKKGENEEEEEEEESDEEEEEESDEEEEEDQTAGRGEKRRWDESQSSAVGKRGRSSLSLSPIVRIDTRTTDR